ncbi:MAG: hypothetical protein IJR85_04545 [Synergistaceae bacterium]|nr:hypothetical protein [Synergistaceae bacterium]
MRNLVLFGAGGLGRETLLLLDALNARSVQPEYRMLGFVVEEKYYRKNAFVGGYPVLGTEEWLFANKDNVVCTCAIGIPEARARIQRKLIGGGGGDKFCVPRSPFSEGA